MARAIAVAFGVGVMLQLAHAGQHEAHEVSPLLHWLRDSALGLPAAILAVASGEHLAHRLLRWADVRGGLVAELCMALIAGLAYALLSVPGSLVHGRLFGAEHEGMSAVQHLGWEAAQVLGSTVEVLLVLAALRPLLGTRRSKGIGAGLRGSVRLVARPRGAGGIAAIATLTAAFVVVGLARSESSAIGEGTSGGCCGSKARSRLISSR